MLIKYDLFINSFDISINSIFFNLIESHDSLILSQEEGNINTQKKTCIST